MWKPTFQIRPPWEVVLFEKFHCISAVSGVLQWNALYQVFFIVSTIHFNIHDSFAQLPRGRLIAALIPNVWHNRFVVEIKNVLDIPPFGVNLLISPKQNNQVYQSELIPVEVSFSGHRHNLDFDWRQFTSTPPRYMLPSAKFGGVHPIPWVIALDDTGYPNALVHGTNN